VAALARERSGQNIAGTVILPAGVLHPQALRGHAEEPGSGTGCLLGRTGTASHGLGDDGKTVVFRRGKTVRLRQQPYAAHTVTGDFDRFIRPLVAAAEDPTKFLWYRDTPAARDELLVTATKCLKEVEPTLENRSLRRGALQALAQAGVPATTLLNYSGHSAILMLKCYLGFGVLLADEAGAHQTAAAQIHSTSD
jgi:hypothetical protein